MMFMVFTQKIRGKSTDVETNGLLTVDRPIRLGDT